MEIQTKFQRYTLYPGHKSFNPRYNPGHNSSAALHVPTYNGISGGIQLYTAVGAGVCI